jgi:hypothetical protein
MRKLLLFGTALVFVAACSSQSQHRGIVKKTNGNNKTNETNVQRADAVTKPYVTKSSNGKQQCFDLGKFIGSLKAKTNSLMVWSTYDISVTTADSETDVDPATLTRFVLSQKFRPIYQNLTVDAFFKDLKVQSILDASNQKGCDSVEIGGQSYAIIDPKTPNTLSVTAQGETRTYTQLANGVRVEVNTEVDDSISCKKGSRFQIASVTQFTMGKGLGSTQISPALAALVKASVKVTADFGGSELPIGVYSYAISQINAATAPPCQ